MEQGVTNNGNAMDDELQRGFKGRYLQMIALGDGLGKYSTIKAQ
jgi:amino acid permease